MSFEVRVRKQAQADIDEAARWYESQRPGLGGEFLDEILSAFSLLSEHPEAAPEVHRSTRRTLIKRFPFGIFYRVIGPHVVVMAVMHSSRDPRGWQERT